ncbi:MAG: hypothetical protein HC769_29500 [Cyanobacteria bacterium CRU_2_1]|nr:hypothetical protein [Cyanobacteria bacterium RU_5_0]NJR62574.1 hypothetical protein [Cyanobacteria bacterium CRU_2_1]
MLRHTQAQLSSQRQLNRSIPATVLVRRVAVMLLYGGVTGSSLGWQSEMAWAGSGDRGLVAQQIVDGLPPPPSIVFGEDALPSPSVQAPPLTPSPLVTPGSQSERYIVLVNGDSELLLSQVRAIDPGASIQSIDGQQVIQAGVFSDPTSAQRQVSALASQGIGAQVIPVSADTPADPAPSQALLPELPPPELVPLAPSPREVEFGQPPAPDSSRESSESVSEAESEVAALAEAQAFYVVIPGGSQELTAIANQVVRLGDGFGIAQLVQSNDYPRGPHVRVGPFADRDAASRWSRYFRDFGMDARVYYSRN